MNAPAPSTPPSAGTAVHASILVIDDEPQVRRFLKRLLGEHGYSVVEVEDGKQAIESVRRSRYDVAIVDLSMPGIDGLQTIEEIRAIDDDIELILTTGYGTIENAIESMRKGAFDFLPKPIVPKDLLRSIGRALERRDLLERLGLYELSRTLFSTLEPEELYGRVAQSAMQVLRADDVSLMLLDENRELTIAFSTSLRGEEAAGVRQALGERIAGRVAQWPEPVVINEDVSLDARFLGVESLRRIHAAIVCPLTMRDQLLGVLNVNRVRLKDRFTERDRRNAMVLSSLVSLSLGNARLHKELQTRLRQLHDTSEDVIQNEKMTALGNLLSGVAHELNNPLCSVLGYAQLMQQNELDPKVRRGVEVICHEAERATRIVNNLLAFARREKAQKRPSSVNAAVLKALERKAYELNACHIETRVELDPNLPLVAGDPQQLLVLFSNLITNAQQAMFESNGRGTLTIRGEARGDRVIVEVSDDGSGIPRENLRRVFDPFFTTRQVGQGVGLGLSVCFAIMRDHGGAIRVSTDRRSGARFIIELPVSSTGDRAEAGDPGSRTSASGAAPSTASTLTPRVLVADGEPHVQDVLMGLLTEMGFGAETVGTGEGALGRIREAEYEAVIADYALPLQDGRRFAETLREEHPDLARRTIYLTCDPQDEQTVEFALASGGLLVGKPFNLQVLRAAVRRVLVHSAPGSADPD